MELNQTKEINDKHQINNQFFRLLSIRETFTHSFHKSSTTQKERLYTMAGVYTEITKIFRRIIIIDYLKSLSDDEKSLCYKIIKMDGESLKTHEQKLEEASFNLLK